MSILPEPATRPASAPSEPSCPHTSSAPTSLRDRFVVLTGGSSGIGRALASQLRAEGAAVVVGSRRPSVDGVEHRSLDLASTASTAAFARSLLRDGRAIDVLLLNAGVHVPWRHVTTVDAEELHWQVNYLSNFLLVHLLLELCQRSALRRIVYVASEAHRLASVPGARLLGFWHRYARSKEAAITFFLRLQELHPELTVRIVSPGYVDSAIHEHKSGLAARLERRWSRPRSPDAAAREILRTCVVPSAATRTASGAAGIYWSRGRPTTTAPRCLNAAHADALWRASVQSLREVMPDARPHGRIASHAGAWQGLGPAVEQPTTVEELSMIVRRAADGGRSVRAVGQRHSYNDIFHSPGCMVSLTHLHRPCELDAVRGTVTCGGGTTLEALCTFLDERGYALRYCGNYGGQTIAGALATGTHGYGRDGGVMSELVRAVTVMRSDGTLIRRAGDDEDLPALRLGLGTLGVVVDVTLEVERTGPCRYAVNCLPRGEFAMRLDELARGHDYLRFVPHPFDEKSVLYVTIDHLAADVPTCAPCFVGGTPGGAGTVAIPWLRMPLVRSGVGRLVRAGRFALSMEVPFSSLLFVRAGLAGRWSGLARVVQSACDRPDWLNMELAIPRARYGDFERLFADHRPRCSPLTASQPYYTCRVVGRARSALLAPNYERDSIFVDIHADGRAPWSRPFLQRLESDAIACMRARPHWGKVFSVEHDVVRTLYPAANVAAFVAAKRRLDPAAVFSNAYTRRVLGV